MTTSVIDLIQQKGITRLCHFTKSKSFLHIMSNEIGIRANKFFDNEEELLNKNDEFRFDGREDFVCCSIQYPNSWFLKKLIERDQDKFFREWVIIFINPNLILDETTYFCQVNAAKQNGSLIEKGPAAFSKLFALNSQYFRFPRSPSMLSCCPTDGQAEVLVYKNVRRSDIIGVAVPNEKQAREEKARIKIEYNGWDIPIIIAPDLFTNQWSNMARQGGRITERLYESEVKQ
ncbi:DarT ssDNA thymidine ADP-ribosyltransferase family protein [Paenibacillus polymyxa]|uniref:DarT ssDNA thymidine ADP-ribosyltransferase family protein n=1 Tax=Paenibacillus polymyxa TaxID=1406 RepID=UPI002ED3DCDE|nr:DarT ssDNA thymidine ADP-ribosyltransferase family protein [Paenibacillus polymyxa]